MYQDHCLIRVLAACETMGSVTQICSDKTGTLTESRMQVVEGWMGNALFSNKTLKLSFAASLKEYDKLKSEEIVDSADLEASDALSDGPSNVVKRILCENICTNRTVAALDEAEVEVYVPDVFDNTDMLSGNTKTTPTLNSGVNRKSIGNMRRHTKLEFKRVLGNPTEASLLRLASGWGFSVSDVKEAVMDANNGDRMFEFNSFKKRSSVVVHRPDGSVRVYVKGAADWLLNDCTLFLRQDGQVQQMNAAKLAEIRAYLESASIQGLRTICLAHKDITVASGLPPNWTSNPPDTSRLCCDAIISLADPLRPDASSVIRKALKAGINVCMITGDSIDAACAIARRCGILRPGGIAIEGETFRCLSPSQVDVVSMGMGFRTTKTSGLNISACTGRILEVL
jgi:Ca2+-transporting ATPase